MSTLEKAIEIAARSHAGQVDKAGKPYILHPVRVMLKTGTDDGQIVAILHDVIEDSETTAEDLRTQGFSDQIVTAVVALTKTPGEPYDQYIARVCQNRLAMTVKLADLDDNGNLDRIPDPTEVDRKRLEKYRWARREIEKASRRDPV